MHFQCECMFYMGTHCIQLFHNFHAETHREKVFITSDTVYIWQRYRHKSKTIQNIILTHSQDQIFTMLHSLEFHFICTCTLYNTRNHWYSQQKCFVCRISQIEIPNQLFQMMWMTKKILTYFRSVNAYEFA